MSNGKRTPEDKADFDQASSEAPTKDPLVQLLTKRAILESARYYQSV